MAKIFTGKVVSDKMQKTIVVEVIRESKHPVYKKIIRRSKRFKVHNEDVGIKVGDTVEISETRPTSKEKQWKIVSKNKTVKEKR